MFRDYRISLNKENYPLPPREDAVEFYVRTNAKYYEKNLKAEVCLSDLQENAKEVVTEYWDVFYEDGFLWLIRGFSFQIDKGNYPDICCKITMYGPHESGVR